MPDLPLYTPAELHRHYIRLSLRAGLEAGLAYYLTLLLLREWWPLLAGAGRLLRRLLAL